VSDKLGGVYFIYTGFVGISIITNENSIAASKIIHTIRHPDTRVKRCAFGHSVATVSHKHSLAAARHATVVVAVPSTVHNPANYKTKIYYLRLNLKV
jgi:hypothetical protein